jgi:putative oxidoreductase
MKQLSKYSDEAYAALRIMAGFMLSFHGMQKIFGILTEQMPAVGSQMWFGGLIELVGGALILVGFQTRWAAFIASGTMAVAYFQFHLFGRPIESASQLLPLVNHGELAVLYCFVFLFLATRGGVLWCLDKKS